MHMYIPKNICIYVYKYACIYSYIHRYRYIERNREEKVFLSHKDKGQM